MDAGLELDILIAKEVMGLNPVKTVWGKQKQYHCWSLGEPDYYDDCGAQELLNPLPEYSTDIASAWEIVKKLESLGWSSLVGKDSIVWRARFYKGEESKSRPGKSAPHAICLAALAAIKE